MLFFVGTPPHLSAPASLVELRSASITAGGLHYKRAGESVWFTTKLQKQFVFFHRALSKQVLWQLSNGYIMYVNTGTCMIAPSAICREKAATLCIFNQRGHVFFLFGLKIPCFAFHVSATVAFALRFWVETSCIPEISIRLHMNNFLWILWEAFVALMHGLLLHRGFVLD